MKILIGIFLILGGIVAGLYIGIWIMFIGGIIDVIEFVKQGLDNYGLLTWGIVKICCASFVGWLSAIILIIPGWAILDEA